MFNKFKKKLDLYSPVNGVAVNLEKVPDDVFAKKMMGNGIAFLPEGNQFCAPCDGTITMIASTKHAFGIKAKNGVEILIHIGLDTVNFQGKGFSVLQSVDSKVSKGTPIIEIDRQVFLDNSIELITPMIVTDIKGMNMETLDEKEVLAGKSRVIVIS